MVSSPVRAIQGCGTVAGAALDLLGYYRAPRVVPTGTVVPIGSVSSTTILASFNPPSAGWYEVTATTELQLPANNAACWFAVADLSGSGGGVGFFSPTLPVKDIMSTSPPAPRSVPITTTGVEFTRPGVPIDVLCTQSGPGAAYGQTVNMTGLRVDSKTGPTPRRLPKNSFRLRKGGPIHQT